MPYGGIALFKLRGDVEEKWCAGEMGRRCEKWEIFDSS